MRTVITILYVTGGFLFIASAILYVYVRTRLYPRNDPELDDLYYEFEEHHAGYARYLRWSHISMVGAVIGVLLLFLGIAI